MNGDCPDTYYDHNGSDGAVATTAGTQQFWGNNGTGEYEKFLEIAPDDLDRFLQGTPAGTEIMLPGQDGVLVSVVNTGHGRIGGFSPQYGDFYADWIVPKNDPGCLILVGLGSG